MLADLLQSRDYQLVKHVQRIEKTVLGKPVKDKIKTTYLENYSMKQIYDEYIDDIWGWMKVRNVISYLVEEMVSFLYFSLWLASFYPTPTNTPQKRYTPHVRLVFFSYPHLLLVPFCASKGTSLTEACIFFYTPAITIKAQPLRIVPSICETVSLFQLFGRTNKDFL